MSTQGQQILSVFLVRKGCADDSRNQELPDDPNGPKDPEKVVKALFDKDNKETIWLTEVDGCVFALTKRQGFRKLNSGNIHTELDFGLRVVVSAADGQKLSQVSTRCLIESPYSLYVPPIISQITCLHLKRAPELVKRLAEIPQQDYEAIFEKDAYFDHVRISVPEHDGATTLRAKCKTLIELHQKWLDTEGMKAIRKNFPRILDLEIIPYIEAVPGLCEAIGKTIIRGQEDNLQGDKGDQEALDDREVTYVRFSLPAGIRFDQGLLPRKGDEAHRESEDLPEVHVVLRDSTSPISVDELILRGFNNFISDLPETDPGWTTYLHKKRITIRSDRRSTQNKYSMIECMVCRVKIPDQTSVYYIEKGECIRIDGDCDCKLTEALERKVNRMNLPSVQEAGPHMANALVTGHRSTWQWDECQYNKAVPQVRNGTFVCLDGVLMTLSGIETREACDLCYLNGNTVGLCHIKRYDPSVYKNYNADIQAQMGKLFVQARTSALVLTMWKNGASVYAFQKDVLERTLSELSTSAGDQGTVNLLSCLINEVEKVNGQRLPTVDVHLGIIVERNYEDGVHCLQPSTKFGLLSLICELESFGIGIHFELIDGC